MVRRPSPDTSISLMDPLSCGARVRLTGRTCEGTVRYVGKADFDSEGTWVGVELDGPEGRNDGSVGGVAYFSCAPLHGVFVRPEKVRPAVGAPPRAPFDRPLAGGGPSEAAPPAPQPMDIGDGTACPVCTFVNAPGAAACEMCGTPLAAADAPATGDAMLAAAIAASEHEADERERAATRRIAA